MTADTIMLAIPSPLDWRGRDFLLFYVIALIAAGIWCNRRANRALDRFDRRMKEPLVDPFEIAFLAAGAGRVIQLAITRLIHSGLLEWISNGTKAALVATTKPAPGDLHPAEQVLFKKAKAMGAKGILVREVGKTVEPTMRSIEVSLATRGLRPTTEERRGASLGAVLPLLALFAFGVAKVVIGVSREKPVLFLIILLFVTIFVTMIFGAAVKRLTASGEAVLADLRTRNEVERAEVATPDEGGLPLVSNSVALYGPSVLAAIPLFSPIHGHLERMQAKATAKSSSGCSSGCSSGGSDGDGGGGCGSGCGSCGGGGD